jgi:hypothetical protein
MVQSMSDFFDLNNLSEVEYRSLMAGFVHDLRTPLDILRAMFPWMDSGLRHDFASRSDCPADLLSIMARDPIYFVRLRVAENFNTPLEILRYLIAYDEVAVVCRRATTYLRKREAGVTGPLSLDAF